MSSTQRHSIQKSHLKLNISDSAEAHELQSRVLGAFHSEVLPLLEEAFDRVAPPDMLIRIDRLQLDLGALSRLSLERDFVRLVKEALDREIPKLLALNQAGGPKAEYQDLHLAALDTLETYLMEGLVPWAVQAEQYQLDRVLSGLLDTRAPALKSMLLRVGVHEAARWRMAKQLRPVTLRRVLRLIAPAWMPVFKEIPLRLQQLSKQWTLMTLIPLQQVHWVNAYVLGVAFAAAAAPLRGKVFPLADQAFEREGIEAGSSATDLPARLVLGFVRFVMREGGLAPNQALAKLDAAEIAPLLEVLVELKRLQPVEARALKVLDRVWQEDAVAYMPARATLRNALVAAVRDLLRPNVVWEGEKGLHFKRVVAMLYSQAEAAMRQSLAQMEALPDSEGNADIAQALPLLVKALAELDQQPDEIKEESAAADGSDTTEWEAVAVSKKYPPRIRVHSPEVEPIYVSNAGLVLLNPFFQTCFEGFGWLEGGAFVDPARQEDAVLFLAWLASGEQEVAEPDLPLLKMLCGMDLSQPVRTQVDLPGAVLDEADALIQAAVNYWGKLGRVDSAPFRQAFLQREGKLLLQEGGWQLKVERRSMDVLLEFLPWGFGVIKLPWMQRLLAVNW